MASVTYGSEIFEYEIIRKKNKTIGIKITPEGRVVVTSPYGVDDKTINDIVCKKAEWIISKLMLIREINKNAVLREFTDGETIEYLGKSYSLKIIEDFYVKDAKVKLCDENLEVYINSFIVTDKRKEVIRNAVLLWLRHQAKIKFFERTRLYGEKLKLIPKRIVIKEQKTLWGSCSSLGNINYNWKLIMAPLPILDYVVVHELCHLKHKDHSKRYWDLVESIIPDYKEKRKWLKENGRNLYL